MHAVFHPRAHVRTPVRAHAHTHAHTDAHAVRRRAPADAARTCVMQLTVHTDAVTALRALVMRVCGDALEFMRIEACEHGARMKVWLCVGAAMVGQVMEAVMRALPGAEFGRFVARPAP